ncbi:hypothetical protein [Natronolimnohabitans innermongolicus]|uniref:Uncharacterized protein n=1 Tax=Natronolimnohabitans innermongolicus JCM 12255 TaxID=1227499 RepID=L9WEF6_9EURY|nr:hypothetical protein [Natronolimnohabitans innermongolicus]ELY47737.1 hypothetical protein C493_22216 [Natronolimnohabitans innermongolicus JCM 12255]
MIPSELLPTAIAGTGVVSALVLARWAWRAQVLAHWARTVALVLVLVAVGAAAGVVDLERLYALVRLVSGA